MSVSSPIHLAIPESDQRLIVSPSVVDHILSYRQHKFWHREAGGQLFARLSKYEVFVSQVTGPRPSDKRTRYSYIPDRKLEQQEIIEQLQRGFVYVGDWHTHPQRIPSPSPTDIGSIEECFKKSKHSLNAFILVIAGTSADPADFHISLHGKHLYAAPPLGE
jgi:integrative and conjugative element protein (TIGR02256 family)